MKGAWIGVTGPKNTYFIEKTQTWKRWYKRGLGWTVSKEFLFNGNIHVCTCTHTITLSFKFHYNIFNSVYTKYFFCLKGEYDWSVNTSSLGDAHDTKLTSHKYISQSTLHIQYLATSFFFFIESQQRHSVSEQTLNRNKPFKTFHVHSCKEGEQEKRLLLVQSFDIPYN